MTTILESAIPSHERTASKNQFHNEIDYLQAVLRIRDVYPGS